MAASRPNGASGGVLGPDRFPLTSPAPGTATGVAPLLGTTSSPNS